MRVRGIRSTSCITQKFTLTVIARFIGLQSGKPTKQRALIICAILLSLCGAKLFADQHLPENRVSDIQNTRHNFSAAVVPALPDSGIRTVEALEDVDICVFCHTPHASNISESTPLWNRQLSQATYNLYSSGSMDAIQSQPNGSSKLCLSCHDGTIAIGAVNVLNGSFTDQNPATENIMMNINGGGIVMPSGEGINTGFTRNLGLDLSNDHPISFDYDSNLATTDGELRDPSQETHIADRSLTAVVPLENGQVQCTSCHDPHIRSTNQDENIKFLRLNRLQKVEPTTSTFEVANDIICLACHDKAGWVGSAHANELVANETFTPEAAARYEFPAGTQVWESSCLGCHDNHTVQGSQRLLREGTDGLLTVSGVKQGGGAASEETCYLCHSTAMGTLNSQGFNTEVADIKSAFELPYSMPIASLDQPAGTEVHDIGTSSLPGSGKDFIEDPVLLGSTNPINRHAECSDCHNPHRVIRNRKFNDDYALPDAAGTHDHNAPHSNIASGVLKGSWGVEPVFNSDEFMREPVSFDIKRGNPEVNAPENVSQPYVTREYQICMKCHSNYAYITPPLLGSSGGNTPPGTNGVMQYTNQAMEFNSPDTHQGGNTSLSPSGAALSYASNNHRSWHPVTNNTNRDKTVRSMSALNTFEAPFDNHVGTQTMYCSDCHGSNTGPGTVVPDGGENGKPWGPHGSENEFILSGKWDQYTGTPCNGINCNAEPRADQQNDLCFKCHNRFAYAFDNGSFQNDSSGFSGADGVNQHLKHVELMGRIKCTWCHVAVPHGWKNKGLLVNLNDVGPEAGLAPGTEVPLSMTGGVTQPYNNAPYYYNAVLKVNSFATSGNWVAADCGSSGSGQVGETWMTTSCNNLP